MYYVICVSIVLTYVIIAKNNQACLQGTWSIDIIGRQDESDV